jgi:hypothetical protein
VSKIFNSFDPEDKVSRCEEKLEELEKIEKFKPAEIPG